MTVFNVSTAAGLMAAVAQAQSGDTISLAGGTYGDVALRGYKFDQDVTITSADPTNPAILTGLTLREMSGVKISQVTLADQDASTDYNFAVYSSNGVTFDSILLKGPGGSETDTANPFMIRNSQNVAVVNSEVTKVRYGISLLDNSGIRIEGNYFHDIRTDGVRGGGNSNVDISNNLFTDFHAAATDHPDAVQFWTTNTTASAENISITNNIIMRGDGVAMQGIFMRDETNNLPYKNVEISGNLVLGGMYHGIAVGNAEGLIVTGNTVVGYTDQKSWISLNDATVVQGNVAQLFILDGVNQVTAPAGNTVVKPVYDGGASLLGGWLALHPEGQTLLQESAVLSSSYDKMMALVAAPPPPIPVATIYGTDGADRLNAAEVGDSVLIGGKGNDTFTGGDGKTRMEGGLGDDIYNVNSDRDTVVELANGGNDTVYTKINYTLAENVETLRLAATGLTVHGNALDNRVVGSEGADIIYGEGGNDSLQGFGGDDTMYGGAGADTLAGGLGNDRLYGGDGADKLLGNEGDDWLWGGAGDDLLEGGTGNDVMSGDLGRDTFQFRQHDAAGKDTITGFSSAQGDIISLSLIDANTKTVANDAFKFIGTAKFHNVAGELRYSAVTGGVLVQGDLNGDGVADLSILLQGISSVTAKDFLL